MIVNDIRYELKMAEAKFRKAKDQYYKRLRKIQQKCPHHWKDGGGYDLHNEGTYLYKCDICAATKIE